MTASKRIIVSCDYCLREQSYSISTVRRLRLFFESYVRTARRLASEYGWKSWREIDYRADACPFCAGHDESDDGKPSLPKG